MPKPDSFSETIFALLIHREDSEICRAEYYLNEIAEYAPNSSEREEMTRYVNSLHESRDNLVRQIASIGGDDFLFSVLALAASMEGSVTREGFPVGENQGVDNPVFGY